MAVLDSVPPSSFCASEVAKMASAASPELVWQMIRNNHGSLMKARNIRRPFSKEANNLKNVNSYRFNGFVQKNVVGVEPMASGKGAVLITKKKRSSHKPGQSVLRQPLVKGKRVSIQKVRRALKGASYRKDLRSLAARRAAAIIRSQEPPRPAKAKKN
ncbi:60S ribosomal protein L28-like isoform X2 [Amphibalanus amphitrite]|uniref:60S ribosomal protein L28-like isoform X2 n=1 Tax=Amphibalanus amphitrite TaxID=1232801 RepID=UPI001C903404|nr:60S ribosomal protein L28-like isoform X2 [Amphibalanus amphitrite]